MDRPIISHFVQYSGDDGLLQRLLYIFAMQAYTIKADKLSVIRRLYRKLQLYKWIRLLMFMDKVHDQWGDVFTITASVKDPVMPGFFL